MTLGRGSWPGFGRETANDFFHEGVPGAFVAGLDHALGPDLGGAQPALGTAGLGRAPLMALAWSAVGLHQWQQAPQDRENDVKHGLAGYVE
jgi:hypothetical protein